MKLKIKVPKEDAEDDGIQQAIRESLNSSNDDEDKNLQKAISLSMQEACSSSQATAEELLQIQDLENLEKAIKLSMQ